MLCTPRLLQRVRLVHLWCNPQNMTSLVCHYTECTHTQYAPVHYGWLYIPLFGLLLQYRKLLWKVLINFAEYQEMLPKVLRNNLKIFKRKIGKISRNISKNFENYIEKYWKPFQKITGKILEDFEKYFGNFREVFQKTS